LARTLTVPRALVPLPTNPKVLHPRNRPWIRSIMSLKRISTPPASKKTRPCRRATFSR